MSKRIDISGQRFGRLIAIKRVGSTKHRSFWLCRCDCGTKKIVYLGHLRDGHTYSCGCARDGHPTHGATKNEHHTGAYRSWRGMLDRCRNPNTTNFYKYGGRGISVCARWSSFKNFLSDMGERPDGHSIDRINNNGDYRPKNCRWATPKEQRRNQRV